MSLIIDFLLLAASGAACFYCWTLSKRLKSLTDMKTGIHSGIAALSQSTQEMQSALSQTKEAADSGASRLEALLAQTEEKIPELHALSREISEISTQAVAETDSAATNLITTLTPHIADAKESVQMLLNSLEHVSLTKAPNPKPSESAPTAETTQNAAENKTDETADDSSGDVEFINIDIENDDKGEAA